MTMQLSLDPYHNQKLFSDYFLRERVPLLDEWAALADESEALREKLAALLAARRPSGAWKEAQTEHDWIQPVLEALSHVMAVQVSVRTGQGVKKPDYILFPDEAAKQAALAQVAPHDEGTLAVAGALAVADAKRWERPLDATVREGDYDTISANPAVQIDFYLRHTGLRWALLTNGRLWRLYHRDSSKGLDSFYEVDLPALIEAGDGAAFRYFYAFFRREAFVAGGWLDTVLAESRAFAQGVSDTLKGQVYEALAALAQGFLDLPENRLEPTPETLKAIYDNSLIVLYRLLFTLFAESRELLPVRTSGAYRESYSLEALKRQVARALDRDERAAASVTTLWPTVRALWNAINRGNVELAIPAYNGGLFAPERHPFLEANAVGDRHLRRAIDLLARATAPDGQRVAVDYRDLAVRHLGAIYEGLLEFSLSVEAGQVVLLNDKGERKASGSYYTPDYIVQYIVEQTLGPLVDALAERHADDPAALAEAILRLNVLDPAAGSGHFLVGATDYLAQRLLTVGAEVPPAEAASGESELAYWRRRVVASCIYGVDLNPLAVELAKLSLWLNTVARDRPLSFLDHHLRVGNSLVGARISDLDQARPSNRKRSKSKADAAAESLTHRLFDESAFVGHMRVATRFMEDIENAMQATVEEVHEVERVFYTGVQATTERYRQLANIWTAQHFGLEIGHTMWDWVFKYHTSGGFSLPQLESILEKAARIADKHRFFHWELEFPEIFFDNSGQSLGEAAGFDAVVGNPPYGVKLDEYGASFIRDTFEHVGYRVESYVAFIELSYSLVRKCGLTSLIVPDNWMYLDFTEGLRKFVLQNSHVRRIVALPSAVFSAAAVDTCIYVLQKPDRVVPANRTLVIAYPKRAQFTQIDEAIGYFHEQRTWLRVVSSIINPYLNSEEAHIVNRVRDTSYPLGDITNIRYGLKAYQKGKGLPRQTSATMENRPFTSNRKLDETFSPFLEGQSISPYAVNWRGDNWIKWGPWLAEPRAEDMFHGERLLFRKVVGSRLFGTFISTIAFTNTLLYTITNREGSHWDLRALLPILNSQLQGFLFRKIFAIQEDDLFPQILLDDIASLPIRRIEFTTPDDERARLRDEAIAHYEDALATGDDSALLGHVAARLNAEPEQADVVHDLLAHLAERMIALNKEKQARLDDFWLDLEGATDAATFKALHGRGKAESTLWQQPALRPFVREGSGSSRRLDDSLAWNEEAFKGFVALLARRVPKLSALVKVYRDHHPEVQRLTTTIARTDALIDQIVYRLYGLTPEEVAVVEGS